MKLYVDCEFTDFIVCELISIALVGEDAVEFYGEVSDYDVSACSDFVREVVLTQLGRLPQCMHTREELRTELLAWIASLGKREEDVLVCVDSIADWDLIIGLLGDVPIGWKGVLVGRLVNQRRREAYFVTKGGRHHALCDARALRAALPSILTGAIAVADMKPSRYSW
ncbi:hypothetical protein SGO26_01675 [Cupriavidus metallidurans]|uniref:hypothetical protein n=1 Tax=Cupriavidus TaxID=106589 RepID=UPI00257ABD74|nr:MULTISPECIES: hypothetical protein [unclassified Cupriavidus]GMG95062.1 hypothetical protein Cmtc_62820 [Cupriavidus sp. TKC]